jgi:serine/threonine protein kinase
MGEVWRATDIKLGRDVALKVLPESLARDADRLARFARGSQVLASTVFPQSMPRAEIATKISLSALCYLRFDSGGHPLD